MAVIGGFAGSPYQNTTDYGANSWYCPAHGARPAVTYGRAVSTDNGPRESRCCAIAELVHFITGCLRASRRLSPEFQEELPAIVTGKSGLPADADDHTLLPRGSLFQCPYGTIHDLSWETARPDRLGQRLHDQVPERCGEATHGVGVVGDQGRRHRQTGLFQHGELLMDGVT